MYITYKYFPTYKITQFKMNLVYQVTISINCGQTIFDTNMDTRVVSSLILVVLTLSQR